MTDATARRLNSAACWVWFYQQGLRESLDLDHLRTVQQATVAQLQTAADIVDALNLTSSAAARASNTPYGMECILSPDAAAKLKAYADAL